MRSCDLGIVNGLPRLLGAFSISTPDGEYNYRRRHDYEYQERSQSFRGLKCIVGLVNLHGRRDTYAEQKIYATMTMFNFTSRIVREVIIRQPKDGVYAYKANFTIATTLCREFFRTPDANGEEVMQQIARHSTPIRPGRRDERKLKAKGSSGFTYRVAA